MLSVHTSPLDQPGTGDAGGMNVYVVELARQLARRGIEVEIFTRATSGKLPPIVELAPGVTGPPRGRRPVRGAGQGGPAGPAVHVRPRRAADRGGVRSRATTTSIHSHYWLSGQVGALARDRWGVPLVHSMHTMAKVKNACSPTATPPEPVGAG